MNKIVKIIEDEIDFLEYQYNGMDRDNARYINEVSSCRDKINLLRRMKCLMEARLKKEQEIELDRFLTTEESDMGGTDRLCMALYNRLPKAMDYMGGSEAKMLHDAADYIEDIKRAAMSKEVADNDTD